MKKSKKVIKLTQYEFNNYFGEAIKEIRIKKGLTQKEVSKLAGIKQSQWSAYETGKNRPTIDNLIEMAINMKFKPLDFSNLILSKLVVKKKLIS